jgi:hypothetical protein
MKMEKPSFFVAEEFFPAAVPDLSDLPRKTFNRIIKMSGKLQPDFRDLVL